MSNNSGDLKQVLNVNGSVNFERLDAFLKQKFNQSSQSSDLNCGSINLILGCMYASKTDELLRRLRVRRLSSAIQGNKCLLIKYKANNRYLGPNDKPAVVTHDKKLDTDCIEVDCLFAAQQYINSNNEASSSNNASVKYIFIDEGQFFQDLELVLYWRMLGKQVEIAALDAYANQKLWPAVQSILPFCTYEQQKACCDLCGHYPATLSVVRKDVKDLQDLQDLQDLNNNKLPIAEANMSVCKPKVTEPTNKGIKCIASKDKYLSICVGCRFSKY